MSAERLDYRVREASGQTIIESAEVERWWGLYYKSIGCNERAEIAIRNAEITRTTALKEMH